MLGNVLAYLRNYFPARKWYGTYVVSNGSIELPEMQDGQYFRIIGSVFNDGVYKYPVDTLDDEIFTGSIWALAVPKDVVELAAEIKEWQKKTGEKASGPFQSESFGGYSYTLKSGSDESVTSWQNAFKSRLNTWRKI